MLLVLGQGGWWDGWHPPALGEDAEWERLAALLDWRPFEALLAPLRNARRGRPGYPPLALFRALLVRERNNLSTRGLERALRQSLVLRRFCGFASGDPTPDHSTFSRFHAALARHGLAARCFAELERQLDAQGLFRKQGGLIDATLLQAQLRPPPYSAGPGARHPLDGDASWTRSGYARSALFGYKAHLNVDLGSLLIRSAALSPAHLAESGIAGLLLCGDECAIYADKAYDARQWRAQVAAQGSKDRTMRRAHKHRPLTERERLRNRLIARVRQAVERVFGILKLHYRYRRVRHRGLARNAVELHLKCFCYNLRRASCAPAPAPRRSPGRSARRCARCASTPQQSSMARDPELPRSAEPSSPRHVVGRSASAPHGPTDGRPVPCLHLQHLTCFVCETSEPRAKQLSTPPSPQLSRRRPTGVK